MARRILEIRVRDDGWLHAEPADGGGIPRSLVHALQEKSRWKHLFGPQIENRGGRYFYTGISLDPYALDLFNETAESFFDVRVAEANEGRHFVDFDDTDHWGTFIRLAPDGALKQIHKLMVLSLHPDKGGSEEAMKKLNISWGEIKKERKMK